MPWNPDTNQWDSSPNDNTGQMSGGLAPAPAPRTPGYNNPWYDPQRQGQVGGDPSALGGFLPQPADPQTPNYTDGTNWNNLFGSSPYGNQGGADIWQGMPPSNDYFGSQHNQGGSSPFDQFGKQQNNNLLNYTPGIDTTGSITPYPVGSSNQSLAYGNPADKFGQINSYSGSNSLDYGNPASKFGTIQPSSSLPAPSTGPGAGVGMSQQARQPVVNIDPQQEAYVRGLLEDPNGPYANRKPGDYGPIGSPDFVLNPKTQQDWIDRYNWYQQNPTAFTTGYTQPRDLTAQQYDFSKPNSVPYTVFKDNAFADTNAKQNPFGELQGVLSADKLQQAQKLYGWQPDNSGAMDANSAYQRLYQLAGQDPASNYVVVKFDLGQGAGQQYGVVKRENSVQAQQARGFYAPGQGPAPAPVAQTPRPVPNSYGSRSTGYTKKSVGDLPKPQYTADQIKQQKFIRDFGAGALTWATQNLPKATPVPTPSSAPQAIYDNSYPGEKQLYQYPNVVKPAGYGQYTGQQNNGWTWSGRDWIR